MKIEAIMNTRIRKNIPYVYYDMEKYEDLPAGMMHVGAYCFYRGKLLVVYHAPKKHWTPPGGGIEEGETVEDATIREIKEESNMRVISHRLLGYQEIPEPDRIVRQSRSVCIVEPYGDFESDPDEDITEIKFIDPSNIKEYFDWGIVGDHLIKRAVEMSKEMQQ